MVVNLKSRNVFLIIVSSVLLAIFIMYLYFNLFAIYSVKEIDMYLKVVEGYRVGVNTDTDALYFGKVRKGGLSTRRIIVSNYDDDPHFVQIRSLGELSKWVYVSDNNFLLAPNESRNVSVSCDVPRDAEAGNYTGKLQVIYYNLWGLV